MDSWIHSSSEGQPLEIRVVHHHEPAVFGFHDIELDPVSARLGGGLQSRKCVLHATLYEPAVRQHLRLVTVNQVDHGSVIQHSSDTKSHHDDARCHAPQQRLTARADM